MKDRRAGMPLGASLPWPFGAARAPPPTAMPHPRVSWRRLLLGYALAAFAVATALWLRLLFAPWLEATPPLVTLFGAVAVAVWYGGAGPGLFAAVLGFAATHRLFIAPGTGSGDWGEQQWALLATYAVSCGLIVAVGHALLRARRRLEGEVAGRHAAEAAAAAAREQLRVTLASVAEGRVASSQAAAQALTGWRDGEAHEALYLVVQSSPLAVVVLDTDPPLVRLWNDAAERLFGWPAADVIGRPLAIVPPDRRDEALSQQQHVAAGATLFDVETCRQRADGSRLDVRMSAAPLSDAEGRATGSLLLFADITDRKRAEGLRRQSDATLRTFFDIAPACLGVVEPTDDGDLLHLADNPVACRLFGVAPGGTVQRRASALGVGAPTIRLWLQQCRESAARGAPVDFEYEQPVAQATHRYRATVCPIGPGPEGRMRYGYLAEDVTERKRSEEALSQADRRKDEFLATLAHELRNPLAPLRNGVHLLRLLTGELPAAERPLTIMERQIGHMVRLIDDLLDVGRVSGDKLQLRRQRVDIAQVVQEAIDTSQPALDAAGHALSVRLPPQPVFVDVDPTRLCQVIANLLNNAAKYTPAGGRVQVGVACRGANVEISVEDDGRGIPAHMLPRIFDMFTQVDRSLERAPGGLGIGLAIARRLVQMHGGRLQAHSAGTGRGSRFVVSLPLAERAAEPAPAGPAPEPREGDAPAAGPAGCRVLVADDNADSADSLSNILRLMGHETRVARDGQQAYDAAAEFRPDIALLDIGMPLLNGYDVARRVREQPWGGAIRLVAVTGWGQDADRLLSEAAGFDLHLVKPVDPAALEALVDSVSRDGAADG